MPGTARRLGKAIDGELRTRYLHTLPKFRPVVGLRYTYSNRYIRYGLKEAVVQKKGGANLVCLNNDYLLDPNLGPGRIQIYGPGACPGVRGAGFVPKGSSGLGEIICGRGDIPGPQGWTIKGVRAVARCESANSPTGKRQQLFFSTKAEAQVDCEKLKTRKDNFGISLSAMTSARIATAAEAYNLLDPYGIALLDAVRSHLELIEQKSESVTFETAFDEFAELKQAKSLKYRQEIRHTKATFSPLLGRLICDVSARDLTPILNKLPSGSRNAKMRRLRSVFNLAIKRGWIQPGTSPIARLDFSDGVQKEVEIVPVELVAKMFNYALENDPELVPFLTLGFFCGIRPDGELQKVEWRDIDLADRIVTIRPEVSKTNRRRFPELSENAIAWLEANRHRGGRADGRIVPVTSAVLRKKRGKPLLAIRRHGFNRACATATAQTGWPFMATSTSWFCRAAMIQSIPCGGLTTKA